MALLRSRLSSGVLRFAVARFRQHDRRVPVPAHPPADNPSRLRQQRALEFGCWRMVFVGVGIAESWVSCNRRPDVLLVPAVLEPDDQMPAARAALTAVLMFSITGCVVETSNPPDPDTCLYWHRRFAYSGLTISKCGVVLARQR